MLILVYVLIALQIADLITTAYLLTREGYYETNRILAGVMDRLGLIPTLVISKGIVIGVILWIIPILTLPFLIIFVLIYLVVLGNNLRHVL